MDTPKRIQRIVTCQGTIQLVTALTMMNQRAQEQRKELDKEQNKEQNIVYEDYLVIYDLKTPSGQIEPFAEFIQTMAKQAGNWQNILYLSPERLEPIARKLKLARLSLYPLDWIWPIVHQLVGTSTADEIYLCKNFEFGNQLLLCAYEPAEKICYGDSIGIYLPISSPVFVEERTLANRLRTLLKSVGIQKPMMKHIGFDMGYFTLPTLLGGKPPMPTVIAAKAEMLAVFQKMRGLVAADYVAALRQKIAHRSVFVLLTSNFSEAGRLSESNEVAAYRQLLAAQQPGQDAVLLLKPHPRDGSGKIAQLQTALQDLFSEVIVLSDPRLCFLPFEILFMEIFLDDHANDQSNVTLIAVSSACISLKWLFGVPCQIGFGEPITRQFFYEHQAESRVQHERELAASLEQI